jgi:hypothetical protein
MHPVIRDHVLLVVLVTATCFVGVDWRHAQQLPMPARPSSACKRCIHHLLQLLQLRWRQLLLAATALQQHKICPMIWQLCLRLQLLLLPLLPATSAT